jgi:DNA-binding MarR family transcriptional regulator
MASAPTPTLDEQICFALYGASRAVTGRYRELLAPLGVTYPQYLVLLVLWESDAISVTALGEKLHLDSGTLSPLLRRMEKAGLLTRDRAKDDERSVLVSLTESGDSLRALAAGIPDQLCASLGIGLVEIQAMRDQLALLADHVRAFG